jgi:hypothetical protein
MEYSHPDLANEPETHQRKAAVQPSRRRYVGTNIVVVVVVSFLLCYFFHVTSTWRYHGYAAARPTSAKSHSRRQNLQEMMGKGHHAWVLVVLYLLLVQSSNAQETNGVDENQRDIYKDICTGYISTVRASFTTGGLPGLTRSAYQLAVDNPTGPYLSCTEIYPGVSGPDIRVLVNPFLPLNKTLAELSAVQGSSDLTKALELSAEKAIDSCCGGELISFGLPFNQSESHSGSIVVAEAERDFIAFSEELNDSTYIFCGCPITDVPDGERNNTLALEYLSQQTASQEQVTSDFDRYYYYYHALYIVVLYTVLLQYRV